MKHQTCPATAASAFTPITPDADVPTFEQLIADPAIAALLDFAPVPRRNKKEGGWSADMQRMFIARLARHGSPGKACDELGMYRSGVDKLFKSGGAEAFRGAWGAAVALAERRRSEHLAAGHASVADLKMPFLDNRRGRGGKSAGAHGRQSEPLPGQVLNEHGEYEDQASLDGRVAEVRVKWTQKFLYARRLYLSEISPFPFKRVAFEILTQYPIDWDKAERLEPQEDEPWRVPVMREPAMLLTAENGWMGDILHGEDKKAELRAMLNEHLIEKGEDPIGEDGCDEEAE